MRAALGRLQRAFDGRRTLAFAAAAGLAGFGITALAVAPLATLSTRSPEATAALRGTLTHDLPMPALAPQLRALAEQRLEIRRSAVTMSTEDLDALLARLGVADAEAALVLRRHGAVTRALAGRALVQARSRADGRLLELSVRHAAEAPGLRDTHFGRLVLHRDEGGEWQIEQEQVAYERRTRLAAATIETSLLEAAEGADLPDEVAAQLAGLFSADVDLRREPRPGDRFAVVYEVLAADGEPVPWKEGGGRVLAAEVASGHHVERALWFADPTIAPRPGATGGTDTGGYYAPDGKSLRRAFLFSPVAVPNVTSRFAMAPDPLGPGRVHLGVDYAAPAGARVRAVDDGVVESAGWMNGYGQTVVLDHGQGRQTLYAHLSRIDVTPGERIGRGQSLGAVGATGWATGPHLHFEFRVHGVHRDPATVTRHVESRPLPGSARIRFAQWRERALAQLAVASSLATGTYATAGGR